MEDNKLQQQEPIVEAPIEDIDAFNMEKYNNLKANTVSKDKYNKLEKAYKDLFNSFENGEQVAAATPAVPEKSLEDLRKELFRPDHDLSNLEFIEKSLELRQRVMEETGEDCFVSRGPGINPTAESYAAAQRVADVYQECIDYANGDSEVFTNELLRRMPDSPLGNKIMRR